MNMSVYLALQMSKCLVRADPIIQHDVILAKLLKMLYVSSIIAKNSVRATHST